jgi:hypothetical protein
MTIVDAFLTNSRLADGRLGASRLWDLNLSCRYSSLGQSPRAPLELPALRRAIAHEAGVRKAPPYAAGRATNARAGRLRGIWLLRAAASTRADRHAKTRARGASSVGPAHRIRRSLSRKGEASAAGGGMSFGIRAAR